MQHNVFNFKDTKNDDSLAHVENFVEPLTLHLITNFGYYLVWFSSILKDRAYKWYKNYSLNL